MKLEVGMRVRFRRPVSRYGLDAAAGTLGQVIKATEHVVEVRLDPSIERGASFADVFDWYASYAGLADDLEIVEEAPTSTTTLADWLMVVGAYEHDAGINYRIDIDDRHYVLLCRITATEKWDDCDLPTALDDDGLAQIWRTDNDDDPLVTMRGTIGNLLPIVGAATQVPFFFYAHVNAPGKAT